MAVHVVICCRDRIGRARPTNFCLELAIRELVSSFFIISGKADLFLLKQGKSAGCVSCTQIDEENVAMRVKLLRPVLFVLLAVVKCDRHALAN